MDRFFSVAEAQAVDHIEGGIGRELGRQGLHEFTQTHVMAVPSG